MLYKKKELKFHYIDINYLLYFYIKFYILISCLFINYF